MVDQLIQLDYRVFFAINHGLSNPFFDWLMPLLRNRYFWSPLYLFWIIFFVRNYAKKGIMIVVFLLLTFAVTDMLSSGLLKHAVQRLRPCNDPQLKTEVIARISCGSGFSFPSSHAANHFALAVFLITLFKRKWSWILPMALCWAAAISFAQVYCGVHFPLDVLAGAVFGSIVGYLTGTLLLAFQPDDSWKTGS